MKGFFSFILLLCIFLILIESKIYYFNTRSFDYSQLIAIERAYGNEMNLKEQFFEGSRIGANEGLEIYLLSKEAGFRKNEAELMVKIKIIEKISMLSDAEIEDFKIKIWCGNPFDFELEKLMEEMFSENKLKVCNGCAVAENFNCFEFIDIQFSDESFLYSNVPLIKYIKLGNRNGNFGISLYSEKFQIAQAFKIPEKEVEIFEIRTIGD